MFVTGKLAERQLRRILKAMKPEFSYKINQIGVNVAALMSENILMRRVTKDDEIDRILTEQYDRGMTILTDNRDVLDMLAKFLIEKEKISGVAMLKEIEKMKPELIKSGAIEKVIAASNPKDRIAAEKEAEALAEEENVTA